MSGENFRKGSREGKLKGPFWFQISMCQPFEGSKQGPKEERLRGDKGQNYRGNGEKEGTQGKCPKQV